MADIMTPEKRSRLMSHVRGQNTGPEVQLRKALWATGLRYRLGVALPGKPDLVFFRARVAVFVDGCFWHGCPEHATRPQTNAEFWREKLDGNIERDRRVNEELLSSGWMPLRVWQHEIEGDLERVVARIRACVG